MKNSNADLSAVVAGRDNKTPPLGGSSSIAAAGAFAVQRRSHKNNDSYSTVKLPYTPDPKSATIDSMNRLTVLKQQLLSTSKHASTSLKKRERERDDEVAQTQ